MKTFAAAPGEPIIPVPLTVTIPTLRIMETAFTTLPPLSVSPEEIMVPSRDGLEEFRIRTATLFSATSCVALGLVIIAQSYDSTRYSKQDIAGERLDSLSG